MLGSTTEVAIIRHEMHRFFVFSVGLTAAQRDLDQTKILKNSNNYMLAHIMSSYRNTGETWDDFQGNDASIKKIIMQLTIVRQTI